MTRVVADKGSTSLPVQLVVAIVLYGVFMGAGAAGASFALSRTVPLYQADSALLFSPILSKTNSTAAFNSVNYISARINAYAVLGSSQTFQNRVRAGLPDGGSSRLEMSVVGQADSLLLNVSATDVSRRSAAAAVERFDQLLVAQVEDLDGTAAGGAPLRVDVIAGPTAAPAPVSPNRLTYYGVGVLGGFALATGVFVSFRRLSGKRTSLIRSWRPPTVRFRRRAPRSDTPEDPKTA